MTLCSKEDVMGLLVSNKLKGAFKDNEILTAIEAAQAEVYAHITPCYFTSCPFAEPDVPPILRWDTAQLAKAILIMGQTGPNEPNKSDYGMALSMEIKRDLEKIVNCEKGVARIDGSIVKRDIPCPAGSPNANASSTKIMTSSYGLDSEDDRTIFSLRDNPRL